MFKLMRKYLKSDDTDANEDNIPKNVGFSHLMVTVSTTPIMTTLKFGTSNI